MLQLWIIFKKEMSTLFAYSLFKPHYSVPVQTERYKVNAHSSSNSYYTTRVCKCLVCDKMSVACFVALAGTLHA